MEKPISRQRIWQIKKQSQGLCISCGKRKIELYGRCDVCLEKYRVWLSSRIKIPYPPAKPKIKILIIGGAPIIRKFFKNIFRKTCKVSTTIKGEDALCLAGKNRYDIILINTVLNGEMESTEVINKLKKINPGAMVVSMHARNSGT